MIPFLFFVNMIMKMIPSYKKEKKSRVLPFSLCMTNLGYAEAFQWNDRNHSNQLNTLTFKPSVYDDRVANFRYFEFQFL